MIKIVALVKSVSNAADGGYVIKLDVSEQFGVEAGELLQSAGKNLAIAIEEIKNG